jgi:hypothetical protein
VNIINGNLVKYKNRSQRYSGNVYELNEKYIKLGNICVNGESGVVLKDQIFKIGAGLKQYIEVERIDLGNRVLFYASVGLWESEDEKKYFLNRMRQIEIYSILY